ncbi:hypothetical protein QKW52_09720 [Bacillus sonorensis]|nr:hypothetical protein [Bacillus sonorensis]
METLTRDIVNLVDEKIVPQVHELQTYQNEKGEIAENRERAKQLLLQLSEDAGMIYEAVDLQDAASAFKEDVQDWISRGLGETPYFDRLLTAYRPPQDQEATFFLAPVVTPNGPHTKGCFLKRFSPFETSLAMMKPIEEELPHPENGCQSLKLITGTKGFTEEKCIVFFPENVKTKEKITSQTFAIFYFNKFYQIYHEDTLKRAKAIFENVSFKSANISPESTYEARVLWGYLHDYYHHCGKKPFHKHIHAKMNFLREYWKKSKWTANRSWLYHSGNIRIGKKSLSSSCLNGCCDIQASIMPHKTSTREQAFSCSAGSLKTATPSKGEKKSPYHSIFPYAWTI